VPIPAGTPTPTALARPGSTGAFVVDVQLRLGLGVDGLYGPATRAAVTAFQRARDLPASGMVDAATWAELELLPTACPPAAAEPITAAPGAGKTVALTFDDGPGPITPQVLAVLSRFGVPATFFDTGLHDVTYPQYARNVVAAGDVLGNHTYNHYKNWGYAQYFTAATQRRELTGRLRCKRRSSATPPVSCAHREAPSTIARWLWSVASACRW
jgi:hypothetical protein